MVDLISDDKEEPPADKISEPKKPVVMVDLTLDKEEPPVKKIRVPQKPILGVCHKLFIYSAKCLIIIYCNISYF